MINAERATGFTRYASKNLQTSLEQQLIARPVDLAVISFGANDTFDIYEGGKKLAFLSDDWKRLYGDRLERYVATLKSSGAGVYWLGLPVMEKPSFDEKISALNMFYAVEMEKLHVDYFETRSRSVDETGNYAKHVRERGKPTPTLIRADDGIHMSMYGYRYISGPLIEKLTGDVALARAGVLPPNSPTPVAFQVGR